jgi:hypothetical protein
VVEKVLRLLRRKERWLVVAGVRFLRTCIGARSAACGLVVDAAIAEHRQSW